MLASAMLTSGNKARVRSYFKYYFVFAVIAPIIGEGKKTIPLVLVARHFLPGYLLEFLRPGATIANRGLL
jgi:hypothetical protein